MTSSIRSSVLTNKINYLENGLVIAQRESCAKYWNEGKQACPIAEGDIVDKEVLVGMLGVDSEICYKCRAIWKKMQARRLGRG